MTRRIFALLMALVLAAACCQTGLAEETCTHEGTVFQRNFTTDVENRIVYPHGSQQHWYEWHSYAEEFCQQCGEVLDAHKLIKTMNSWEDHTFVNGVCSVCGFDENAPCTHEYEEITNVNPTSDYEAAKLNVAPYGSEGHSFEWHTWYDHACARCGGIVEAHVLTYTHVEKKPHTYENDVCTVCGYENTCAHENTETKVAWGYCKYTPYDSNYHSMHIDEEETVTCKDCGKVVSFRVLRTVTQQAYERHSMWHNECEECGYVSPCTHENLTRVEDKSSEYLEDCASAGEQGHTGKLVKVYAFVCADCGSEYVKDSEDVHTGETVTRPHTFYEGKCEVCGYENVCAHAHQTEKKEESYGDYWCPLNQAAYEGHEVTYHCDKVMVCDDCGEEIESTRVSDGRTYTEPHTFVSGVCKFCRFVLNCDHANAYEKDEVETEVIGSTEDKHTVKRVTHHIRRCDDCNTVLSETQSQPAEVIENHTFVSGKCSVCGAAARSEATATPKPTATVTATPAPTAAPSVTPDATADVTAAPAVSETPTAAPETTAAPAGKPEATATPALTAEPVYEDVAAEETVHGVKAEDKTPMVETLSIVAQALESEKARAAIVNVEKIVTEEEKAVLERLSLQEQMLTVLCAIGFEDQVKEALAAENVTLSPEAEALKEQILARIAAMDEEERAAFQKLLEENFPIETVEMDGVEYRFFVLEVSVETEEGTHSERYGFREEEGAWIFVKLSVADMAK